VQLAIKIGLGLDGNEMPPPPRPVVRRLYDAGAVDPPPQGKGNEKTCLAGIQTGKPHSRHAHKACLLRNDLDITE
jgi:hypothetical protein